MRAGRLAGPGANGWRVVAARIKKCSPTPDCTAHEREMADRELKGGHPAVREARNARAPPARVVPDEIIGFAWQLFNSAHDWTAIGADQAHLEHSLTGSLVSNHR